MAPLSPPTDSGEPAGRQSAESRRTWLASALLATTVMAVYASGLEVPFLWDDVGDTARADVRALAPLGHYFSVPFPVDGASAAYFRPLMLLSLALDHAIWGDNVVGFHLTSLALHVSAALVVLALARRAGAGPVVGGVLALGWALLPRSTEAVTWISGRPDVGSALACLVALLVFRTESVARCWLAAIALLGGLLFKESAVVGLVAIGALVTTESIRAGEKPWSRWPRLAPLGFACALYAILRVHAMPKLPAADVDGPPIARIVRPLVALGRYVAMLADPFHPSINIGLTLEFREWGFAALGLAALVATGYGTFRARRAPPLAIAALALTLGSLLTVIHLVPMPSTALVADRRLYLPLAGGVVAAASALSHASLRSRRVVGASLGLFAVACAAAIAVRHADMRSPLRFWAVSTRDARPDNLLPAANLAGELARSAHDVEAVRVCRFTLDRRSPLFTADSSLLVSTQLFLAEELGRMGRGEEAARIVDEVRRAQPDEPAPWLALAMSHARGLDFERARDVLDRAEAHFPNLGRFRAERDGLASVERAWHSLPLAAAPGVELAAVARRRAEILDALGADRVADASWLALALAPDASLAAAGDATGRLLQRGRLSVARAALQALAAGSPTDPRLRAFLELAALREGEDAEIADALQVAQVAR